MAWNILLLLWHNLIFSTKKLATQHMVGFLGKGLLVDPTPKKSDLLRLTNDF